MKQLPKEYDVQDMMDEIQNLRNIVKVEINWYVKLAMWIQEVADRVKEFCNFHIKHLWNVDSELIKRHNTYFLKKQNYQK